LGVDDEKRALYKTSDGGGSFPPPLFFERRHPVSLFAPAWLFQEHPEHQRHQRHLWTAPQACNRRSVAAEGK
jgi:hypothetical protein